LFFVVLIRQLKNKNKIVDEGQLNIIVIYNTGALLLFYGALSLTILTFVKSSVGQDKYFKAA